MKPLIANQYCPEFLGKWENLRTWINQTRSKTWQGFFFGIDLVGTVVFAVISTVGIFGVFGEPLKWFGILNLWRVTISLIMIAVVSSQILDRDRIPLANNPSSVTQVFYWILYAFSHAMIILAAEGGVPIGGNGMIEGARWLLIGLFVSKIINLNHTKDFDLQDAFIGAPKFLLKDIPAWVKSHIKGQA